MAAIQRLEQIECWQSARRLAGAVYSVCRDGDLGRDFALRDQLQRAAVSVMANIAEGFGRQGRKEFLQFLRIARGSCTEVQSHLYLASDAGLISRETFADLQEQADHTGRKISAFINYLSRAPEKGTVREDWPIYTPDSNNEQRIERTTNNEPEFAFR